MCCKVKGIPNSISATYYILEHKLWFGFAIISTAILLMIALLNIVPASIQFLAFLSGAGMMFVGAAPNFKEDLEGKVHTGGAITCIVCSQVLIGLVNLSILITWMGFVMFAVIYTLLSTGSLKERFLKSKPLFWVEIIALLSVYLLIYL